MSAREDLRYKLSDVGKKSILHGQRSSGTGKKNDRCI